MSSESLEKGYEPSGIEEKWYSYWLEKGFFSAKEKSDRKAYSIVIPPPNVTGVLHMGHALNITIQDILCRYRRLCGDNVLWMPGTDHAGIATQNVVEKHLALEGITRDHLGRDKFVEEVWSWKNNYGGAIINQQKRLGASCDWDRERFTMDQGLSDAVRKVFVRLYRDGLIYQGQYIINWCPRCRTALADLEVEHEEEQGFLYHIRYPFEKSTTGKDGLVVATTRPETLFGDTAVAINPGDERYLKLTETRVRLPLTNRLIPIIKDEYVDMSFGTGVLKVTPAHDSNDFNLGETHGLERIKVIDDDGIMTDQAGELFTGLERFECRKKALQELEALGLIVKTEPLKHNVGHCYRCKAVVEPSLSKQWFVKAAPLAKVASDAVRNGETRIIPQTWEKTYFDWLDNIQDWCISRQIWWGHRIPVWKCMECDQIMVEEEDPASCSLCASTDIVQESDVLDTWFSSALWPFSTMGWPDDTDLLKTFYPTSALVTGFDILFFWVARMMMMGTRFMGAVPFRDVYIHALVRDEHGKKMSKSKGNVIDPLKVIDNYGADAFRFTLAVFAAQGRDVRMSEGRVEGYRHFVNKLWNASRFALMHSLPTSPDMPLETLFSMTDRWILSRNRSTLAAVAGGIENYRFNEAAGAVYHFVWHEFCDWYLEASKPALYGKEGDVRCDTAKWVLAKVLRDILVMLHPFMPFVTEELWQALPMVQGSIMEARYPGREDKPSMENQGVENQELTDTSLMENQGVENQGLTDTSLMENQGVENQELTNTSLMENKPIGEDVTEHGDIHGQMTFVFDLVSAIRNIRAEMNIQPSMQLNVFMETADEKERSLIQENSSLVRNLSRLDSLLIAHQGREDIPSTSATTVVCGTTIHLSLKGVIDFDKEEQRLGKEIGKVTKELVSLCRRLSNESFLEKAPEDVVENVKAQQKMLQEKSDTLNSHLERIRNMRG
ncbi:MAG: valine--tRNA ligase [Desulfamplus sp.]|nr:valine--tRNA ligase [Desulfamplus sp.]